MKSRSLICVAAATLSISCVLTSCASKSSAPEASWQIYQPRVLRLKAGSPVATRDGTYLPQVDEVWHSDSAYRQLEQELINTAAALAQTKIK